MSNPVTSTIECTEKEYHDILTACQATIFRDIWRLNDADVALSMYFALQRALPDDLDRSNTPKLNALASCLREAPDTMRYLEFSVKHPSTAFPVLRFADEHNRRAAEIRAAQTAEQEPSQLAGKEAAAV